MRTIKLTGNKLLYRYLFIIIAMMIAFGSLLVSHLLVKNLSEEETYKIKIWAEAEKEVILSEENDNVNNLILQILEGNKTIPVILHDVESDWYTSMNIELPQEEAQDFLRKKAKIFAKGHQPILIKTPGIEQYVYYDDSYTLKQLQIFPYIQLIIMGIFVVTSFIALLSTKRMEQDRVWVGLSKETAHQLGTPISSLMAWVEYLKLKGIEKSILCDMQKDIMRLQTVTERFSKIGSSPSLALHDLSDVLRQAVDYLKSRMSKKVDFNLVLPQSPVMVNISEALFVWVVENLTKNAIDAMAGNGSITYRLIDRDTDILLEITDTGKGMPKSKFKEVFSPGYTTKERGWGLGLSLAKRIIETYHKGKIYVKYSELGVGTTFNIELPKMP